MSIETPKQAKRGGILGDPDDEHTFETEFGAFTLRRPSIATSMEIHKQAARNLEGVENVNVAGQFLNMQIATITVCARRPGQLPNDIPDGFPENFTWDKPKDPDFVSKLFGEYSQWLDSFRKSGEPDADKEGSAGRGKKPSVRASKKNELGAKES